MTAIYLPTWSKIITLLLVGAILGGLLTIAAVGREVDAYNGQAPGYEPGSRMTFEGKDG